MRKETFTFSQAVFTLLLFLFGSSVVLGVSGEAGQDAWVSVLLAAVMMIPLMLMYARIMRLFPETDFFDILENLFGKILGKLLVLLITWYAIHLCALVVRNFTEFLQIVSMPETPQLPMMIALISVTAYLAASGVSALGKWSMVMFPIVMLIVTFTIILALADLDVANLQPVFEAELPKVLTGAYYTLTFPFAETVLFLCMAGAVKKQVSPYKLYTFSIFFGCIVLIVIVLRNVMILGTPMVGASYFPSYTTARLLHVGDFLTRIEGTITMNFLLAGITKVTVCLLAAAKGMAKLFNITDYRRIMMPVAMLTLALCAIVYKSAMEMFGFLSYYAIYAIPFQILIPAAVWITAEIRAKKHAAA